MDVQSIQHPYALVATQDCDLEQDYAVRSNEAEAGAAGVTSDKLLPSVFLLHLVEAGEVYALSRGRDIRKRILQNKDERYHFLQKATPTEDALGQGLPELAIDFKRYFTLPTDELYACLRLGTERRCRLRSPYLEHLASRFAHYLARVALPAEHASD